MRILVLIVAGLANSIFCHAAEVKPSKTPEFGSVRGIVKFKGKQIPAKPVIMAADPYCAKFYAGKKGPLKERWKWGKNDTLQNVVVYVSKVLPERKWTMPKEDAELHQLGCVYRPHVQVIRTGQTLKIINDDNTLHVLNFAPKPPLPPLPVVQQPVQGLIFKVRLKQTGELFIKCNVHAWMSAYVHILDHPFHAITGEEGTFEINGLPPGKYELSTWHEFRRFAVDKNPIKVKVNGGEVTNVVFTYSPK